VPQGWVVRQVGGLHEICYMKGNLLSGLSFSFKSELSGLV
jgi:hypothetical protein